MIKVSEDAIAKMKEILEYPKSDTIRLFVAGAG